jgi:Protein of unknown function (DUF742)
MTESSSGGAQPLWSDAAAGPLVRLYALTRGRARPASQIFDLISLITAQTEPESEPGLSPEQAALLRLCRSGPQSVAELAAGCDLPLGVVRVILSDLLEFGHIHVRRPLPPNSLLNEQIFQEVINGLRAL